MPSATFMPALDHSFTIGNEFAPLYKNANQADGREGKEHLLAALTFFEALLTACWCVSQAPKFGLFTHSPFGHIHKQGPPCCSMCCNTVVECTRLYSHACSGKLHDLQVAVGRFFDTSVYCVASCFHSQHQLHHTPLL
jgi:hypothetical protein